MEMEMQQNANGNVEYKKMKLEIMQNKTILQQTIKSV